MKLICQTPTRVDLAGGTLDLWPISHIIDKAATVNVGINVEAECIFEQSQSPIFTIESIDQEKKISLNWEQLKENKNLYLLSLLLENAWDKSLGGLNIKTHARSPKGAGLGGSSSLAICFASGLFNFKAQLLGQKISVDHLFERNLVTFVQNIEAKIIHAPTGIQDYWGAVKGGINIINFSFAGEVITNLDPSNFSDLSKQMILCYSGVSRDSAMNNWEIFKRVFDKNKHTLSLLEELGNNSFECSKATVSQDVEKMLMHTEKDWLIRKKLWPGVETAETKEIARLAQEAGAKFSKVCGAGGGGVMVIFAKTENIPNIQENLKKKNIQILDAHIPPKGLSFRWV